MTVSCHQKNNTEIDLLKNEVQRQEAFRQILNNPELMNELMNKMMRNPQSMHMMMGDEQFMDHMFSAENINYMMEHNKHFMDETMYNVLDHMHGDSVNSHGPGMMHNDSHKK